MFIIFCCNNSFAQIDNFTLTVTPTNETCTANGKLTFSVANTLSGSNVLYTIYKLPNLVTPITVTSVSPFTGLTSGTYRVIATQTLGAQSASKQQDVVIVNSITALAYQLTSSNEMCGLDGTITVTTTTGTAVAYETISGPIIKPLQTSNVLTGLSAGVYVVRVTDNCGEAVVQTYTLGSTNTDVNYVIIPPVSLDCDTVTIGFSITAAQSDGAVKFPLQVTTVVNTPSGITVTASTTITGGTNFQSVFQLYSPQPYTYSFTIVDGCGNSQIITGEINNVTPPTSSYILNSQDCTHKKITLNGVSEVTLVTAPPGFSSSLPINYTSQIIDNELELLDLVAGTYVFNVTDVCGVEHVYTIDVTIDSPLAPYYLKYNNGCTSASVLIFAIQGLVMVSAPAAYNVTMPHDYTSLINAANYAGFSNLPIGVYLFDVVDMCGQHQPLQIVITPISNSPGANVLEGCDIGYGSIKVEGQMTSIIMVSSPAAYTNFSIPHDFTSSLVENATTLTLGSLPPGVYVFEVINPCGTTFTISKEVQGYYENSSADINPNCGSFNINVVEDSNTLTNTYWLQKLDPITNTWRHPSTNVIYPDGSLPLNTNSLPLNLGNNLNLNFIGHFRVLKAFKAYIDNTSGAINCFRVINEFDYSGQPIIHSINSISCNAVFEVLVNAEGIGQLQYSIITKNGQPFLIQNGTSNYFTNLEAAIYSFRVQDACGNIVNRVFEIINPLPFVIETQPITCDFENVTLSLPNFSFLQYQWWKDTQSTTILSTTNTLNFSPFNSAVNNGTYYVNIVYPGNPNSCLNQTLSYEISFNPDVPNAGIGQAISYCGNQETINLFSLLQGSYDADGTWAEITNSGTLTNNLWNSTSVTSGSYKFKYRVDGSCNLFDEAIIDITIFSIPETPIATVDDVVCETFDLSLYATTVANASYNWSGPNGFSSMQQNPLVTNSSSADNGVYSVYVTQNGCPSETSEVTVLVNPLPDFSLNQECLNKDYVLTAITSDESYTYNWIGPNAYTSNQNPITITRGDIGMYSLTITNQNGCSITKEIDVLRTFCEIPNVITPNNDGSNDSLNLIGFDVKKLEIFNRWGRLVFDKINYTNEWHGQSNNGNKLPDGTYFYLIQYNNSETTNGWIFVSGN